MLFILTLGRRLFTLGANRILKMIVLASLTFQSAMAENVQTPTLFNKLQSFFSAKHDDKFIPVRFDDCGIPLIDAEIEGNACSLMLDLGSYAQISLNKAILNKVHKKSYGVAKFTDVRGEYYESQRYLVSAVKVKDHVFSEVIVSEENNDFVKNTEIWTPSEGPPSKNGGTIGRALLKRKNVFLDFPRSRIALTESTNSPKDFGFSIENMIKVPFEITSLGIILSVQTDLGEKRFLLDSGFTRSVIKASQYEDRVCQEDDNGYKYFMTKRFTIANKDFGDFQLHLLDMGPEVNKLDGVLGMSFLRHHSIYIDFRKKVLFIGDL